MGDAAPGHGFESAAAVLEKSLATLLDKFNSNVEERIAAAVKSGLQKIAAERAPAEAANTVSEKTIATLQAKIEALSTQVMKLQKDLAAAKLTRNNNTGDGDDKPAPNSNQNKRGEWTMGLQWEQTWPGGKKRWYRINLQKHEPERAKAEKKALLQKQLARLE